MFNICLCYVSNLSGTALEWAAGMLEKRSLCFDCNSVPSSLEPCIQFSCHCVFLPYISDSTPVFRLSCASSSSDSDIICFGISSSRFLCGSSSFCFLCYPVPPASPLAPDPERWVPDVPVFWHWTPMFPAPECLVPEVPAPKCCVPAAPVHKHSPPAAPVHQCTPPVCASSVASASAPLTMVI